jgi:hypothetical protein
LKALDFAGPVLSPRALLSFCLSNSKCVLSSSILKQTLAENGLAFSGSFVDLLLEFIVGGRLYLVDTPFGGEGGDSVLKCYRTEFISFYNSSTFLVFNYSYSLSILLQRSLSLRIFLAFLDLFYSLNWAHIISIIVSCSSDSFSNS